MKSLSSVVKSSHVILDNKKFVLSTKITMPEMPAEELSALEKEHQKKQSAEEIVKEAQDEARRIIERAMEEAQEHLHEASQEAERIISDGLDQSLEIKEKAKQEGYLDGQREGFDEGRQVAQSLIEEALVVKAQTLEKYKKLLEDAEPEVLNLVTDICAKVLNQKINEDDYIVGLIKMAIDKCTYTTDIALRVSEDDYDYVIMEKDKILALCENVEDINVKMDRSLDRGACIVESPSGTIDSSVQVQLDYVVNRLKEILVSE